MRHLRYRTYVSWSRPRPSYCLRIKRLTLLACRTHKLPTALQRLSARINVSIMFLAWCCSPHHDLVVALLRPDAARPGDGRLVHLVDRHDELRHAQRLGQQRVLPRLPTALEARLELALRRLLSLLELLGLVLCRGHRWHDAVARCGTLPVMHGERSLRGAGANPGPEQQQRCRTATWHAAECVAAFCLMGTCRGDLHHDGAVTAVPLDGTNMDLKDSFRFGPSGRR